jgi:hypothetical protein
MLFVAASGSVAEFLGIRAAIENNSATLESENNGSSGVPSIPWLERLRGMGRVNSL